MQSQAEQEAWSRKVAVVVVVVAVWATTGLPPIGLVAAEPAGIVYLVQALPNGSVDLAIDGRTVAVAASGPADPMTRASAARAEQTYAADGAQGRAAADTSRSAHNGQNC